MLEFIREAGFDGVLPGVAHAGQVGWMHRVRRPPLLQFFECPAKVLEDLAIDVLDLASRRHDGDETRNGFDNQPEAVLAGGGGQNSEVARSWIG